MIEPLIMNLIWFIRWGSIWASERNPFFLLDFGEYNVFNASIDKNVRFYFFKNFFFLYILDIDSINTYCWNFDWGWVYVLFPQELFMFNLFWIFFIKLSNNNVIIWVSLNKQMRFVWSLIQQSFSLKCFRI